jgi:hypothetical protein
MGKLLKFKMDMDFTKKKSFPIFLLSIHLLIVGQILIGCETRNNLDYNLDPVATQSPIPTEIYTIQFSSQYLLEGEQLVAIASHLSEFNVSSGPGSISANGMFTAGFLADKNIPEQVVIGGTRVDTTAVTLSRATLTVYSKLEISPIASNIPVTGTLNLISSGGIPPMAFSVLSGEGSITGQGGEFVSGNNSTVTTVSVRDSIGNLSTATLNIYKPLEVITNNFLLTNSTVAILPSEGISPYFVQLTSGSGQLTQGTASSWLFFAGPTAGTTFLSVSDQIGQSLFVNMIVNPELQLSPTNLTMGWNQSFQFSTAGGFPPYEYIISSGSGSISATTGSFLSPAQNSNVQIKVSDSKGYSRISSISVSDSFRVIDELTFDEPGTYGIFDPSLVSSGTLLYMTYSSALPSVGTLANFYPWLISTRWAESTDAGQSWTDKGSLFNAVEFSVNGAPVSLQYEVSNLVYDPAASSSERWRVFVFEYAKNSPGSIIASSMSIRMKNASSIETLSVATSRKLLAGKAHTDTAPNPMPELTLSMLSSELTNCYGLSEPGATVHNNSLYLAITCYGQSPSDSFIFLLKYDNSSSWSYIGKLLTHVDSVAFAADLFTAPSLHVVDNQAYLIVSPELNGKYKGCYVFKFTSGLNIAQLKRNIDGNLISDQTIVTSKAHNGACTFDPISKESIGILFFENDSTGSLPYARSYRSFLNL